MGDDLRRKPYSMASLDNDWYAVLGGIKRDFWIIYHFLPFLKYYFKASGKIYTVLMI